jgi:hypothetical protein
MAASARGDWLRGVDLNHRPLGYEPNELPDCSTPRVHHNNLASRGQTCAGGRNSFDQVFVCPGGIG